MTRNLIIKVLDMKKLKYMGALVLAALAGCTKELPTTTPDTSYVPRTELGATLAEKCPVIAHTYADSSFLVARGVEETDVHVQLMNGKVEHMFFIKADLNDSGVTLKVGMPYDMDVYSGFQRQTLSEMASWMDAPGRRVAAMVNADFWDVSNGDIRGPIHRNGNILKDTFIYSPKLYQQALSFMAVDWDGKPLIRDSVMYRPMQEDLKECTGAGVVVLRDGIVPDQTNYPGRDPRTCIGYTDNGIVYMLVCDGRSQLWSLGLDYEEMGEIMKSLGCSWAVNFDSGGSSQLLIRHPVADVFQIRNRPTDGAERAVVNAWVISVDEP